MDQRVSDFRREQQGRIEAAVASRGIRMGQSGYTQAIWDVAEADYAIHGKVRLDADGNWDVVPAAGLPHTLAGDISRAALPRLGLPQ